MNNEMRFQGFLVFYTSRDFDFFYNFVQKGPKKAQRDLKRPSTP